MAASASGTSTTPDPPALTPSAGPADYLWLVGFGGPDNPTTNAVDPPGYPVNKRGASSGDGNGVTLRVTCLGKHGASENPGAFSGMGSANWGAFTIAIPPGIEGDGFTPELYSYANSRTASAGTSHVVTLSSPRVNGRLLFAKLTTFGNATQSWPGGWTSLINTTVGGASGVRVEVRYRTIDGSEANTITVTTSGSVQAVHESWQVSEHDPDRPPEATVTSSASSLPRPPDRTQSLAEEYLVIAGFGASDDDQVAVWWPPTLNPIQQVESSQAGSSVMSASSWTTRRGNPEFELDLGWANSLLAPTHTSADTMLISAVENWVAYTIFVYPLIGCQPIPDYVTGYALELRPESQRQQLEFQTRILRAYDGSEQRLTTRCRPRQTFEMTWVLPTIGYARRLHLRLLRYQDTTFDLPLWGEEICVPGALTAGGTSIAANFQWTQIAVGSAVLIVDPEEATYEIRTVTAKTSSTITVAALTNSYPARSFVVPLISVYAQGEPKLSRYRTAGAELSLTAVGVYQPPLVDGGTGAIALASYDGFTVLDKRHLSENTLDQLFDGGLTIIDFGNKLEQYTPWVQDVGAISETRRFFIEDLEDRIWWNAFLNAVVGARETFLAPTWRDDLVLSAQPSVGATTILVTNDPNYNAEYEVSGAHDYLQLETAAGIIYRKVTNAVDNGNGTVTLTLDVALPATTAGSTISRISFLERVRLASDVVQFDVGAVTRALVTISTRTVQE
jgi:hypothetical protein